MVINTCDHVLDVVSVSGAVDVRIMPRSRLVLHAGGVDGDAARTLLGRLVNLLKCHRASISLLGQHLRNGIYASQMMSSVLQVERCKARQCM